MMSGSLKKIDKGLIKTMLAIRFQLLLSITSRLLFAHIQRLIVYAAAINAADASSFQHSKPANETIVTVWPLKF
jgi:hypothetical protein